MTSLTPSTDRPSRPDETRDGRPPWWDAMEFCHISNPGVAQVLCGDRSFGCDDGPTCPPYGGQAVCPGCGYPTCPRCAQLAAIEYAIEEA